MFVRAGGGAGDGDDDDDDDDEQARREATHTERRALSLVQQSLHPPASRWEVGAPCRLGHWQSYP